MNTSSKTALPDIDDPDLNDCSEIRSDLCVYLFFFILVLCDFWKVTLSLVVIASAYGLYKAIQFMSQYDFSYQYPSG